MSDAALPGPPHLTEDEKALHKLGYAQELMRAMGVFRNFAISFTIISILAGCLTSYFIAFQWGGPVSVTWGWLIVGGFTIFVALSMGEIASTYPTAGGLYYWSSKLGSPAWGWFTGWFNLIGLIGIVGAVGYGLATFATALFNLWWSYPNDRHHIFYMFVVFMIVATARQRLRRPHHVAPQRDLGVLARGRRPDHRLRLHLRPGPPPVGQLRVHDRRSTTPASPARAGVTGSSGSCSQSARSGWRNTR